jgi:hypothetical protein
MKFELLGRLFAVEYEEYNGNNYLRANIGVGADSCKFSVDEKLKDKIFDAELYQEYKFIFRYNIKYNSLMLIDIL